MKTQKFENNLFELEVKTENGETLFDVETVAKSLGIVDVKNGIEYVRWQRVNKYLGKNSPLVAKGSFISEPMVYKLAFKANNALAEKFQDWLAVEVLPQIRKHGMYATDELLNNPDLLIEVATKLKEERTLRLVAEQKVAEMQPKVNYHDIILANKSVTPISFIAKNYGMSAIQMNKLLHDFGIQYRQGKAWLLYAKYQNEGYTHIEMVPVQGTDNLKPIMKWTQKGHLFLYNFLKEHDILPNIELF
ncbi:phage antirepressor KilAC domain-containing protein [Enterococcus faecium]|jgi:prophage antirepressor-like protein|uniref:phage antirepressor KilAC domain-containing protein n=1 Tax=Enterococcus faecium TaxID=1352 RepID=UPI000F4F5E77|nr:phage antirepressor KilAC domain-containing protein [Enterococcus faecium]EMF0257394.1 phage antirepressor KilAC domain-containing protein [Enterococcus hirae]MBW4142680.1 phage antirepressor KilAC domain-containing protein [Enterococcus faecium]MDT2352613.1 phage antirepressor KilAC domain-containing protein [Enterococcus faecium]MDW3623116.1 phage antirepressor KilAC domain-containing protein [Enterococcus faecium]NTQ18732.1 phage antirepressor KilAC domain-containing protein [Enterococcu